MLEKHFKRGMNFVLGINFIVGISCVFLLERMTPAISDLSEKDRMIMEIVEEMVSVVSKDEKADSNTLGLLTKNLQNLRSLDAAMKEDLHEARLFATGGAWAIVFLALLGFLLGKLLEGQILRRNITPVSEMCLILNEWRQGNRLRRMHVTEASEELRQASATLNTLLDEHL
ncbi:MAG: hypothetical protein HYW48_06040 [Deltaproteobacteria bacterium]|nr:hypothetical protein [Deltaproteobacteria bacterium]